MADNDKYMQDFQEEVHKNAASYSPIFPLEDMSDLDDNESNDDENE